MIYLWSIFSYVQLNSTLQYDDEDYADPERDDRALVGGGAERERESSVTSNASSASNKMEPPESSRGWFI